MYKSKGFTLIELMVVIAVIVIIAMMAVPSFGAMIANYQLKKDVRDVGDTIKEFRAVSKAENRKIAYLLSPGKVKDGFTQIEKNTSAQVKVNSKATILYFEPNGIVSSNLNLYPICLEFLHSKTLKYKSIEINALGVFNVSDHQCP